ncbi:hypothetical protein CCACVL1_25350 [Corchorus capsularis]|uniref:Uncharacterized protein n=1 Tax=Corchorus capsularis TaxID=210143 RepID=A0A1R3GL25_COCAP|nr:hypothetical protein CCACVL1_25350 [Corchorus capsularis]
MGKKIMKCQTLPPIKYTMLKSTRVIGKLMAPSNSGIGKRILQL